jgi:hypothetical protein
MWVTYADVTWYTDAATGTGTISNPYEINTAEQLAGLAQLTDVGQWNQSLHSGSGGYEGPLTFLGKYIWVTADIDLYGKVIDESGVKSRLYWTPIGLYSGDSSVRRPFSGTLDFGIYMTTTGAASNPYSGILAGRRNINNLYYSGAKLPSSSVYGNGINLAGGFLGFLAEDGVIKNAEFETATAEASGITSDFALAVVAGTLFGTISNTSTDATSAVRLTSVGSVTSPPYVGGLVGRLFRGTVTLSENRAAIKGAAYAGGIVGYVASSTTAFIKLCENYGSVQAVVAGGIVGGAQGGANAPVTVERNGNYGAITGIAAAGGVAGRTYTNAVNLRDCLNVGAVSVTDENDADLKIDGKAISQAVAEPHFGGGIIGYVGWNLTQIFSCYSVGTVSKKSGSGTFTFASGGIIGGTTAQNDQTLPSYVKNNYYLDTSAANGIGAVGCSYAPGVTIVPIQTRASVVELKNDANLKSRATYATETLQSGYTAWDFNVNAALAPVKSETNPYYTWKVISGGYPALARENVQAVISLASGEGRAYNASPYALATDFTAVFVPETGVPLSAGYVAVNHRFYKKNGTAWEKLTGAPADSGNYKIILYIDDGVYYGYSEKEFTITPATLKVLPAVGICKIYGDANPALDATRLEIDAVNGFKGNDVDVLEITGAFQRVAGENAGTYSYATHSLKLARKLGAVTGLPTNYILSVILNDEGRKFTITPRPVTFSLTKAKIVYGEALSSAAFTLNVSNIAPNDIAGDVLRVQSLKIIGAGVDLGGGKINVGVYTAAVAPDAYSLGTKAGNYTFDASSLTGDLEVTKAPLAITVENAERIYGDGIVPSFAVKSITGLKYGDGSEVLNGYVLTSAGLDAGGIRVAAGTYSITFDSLPNPANYSLTAANVTNGVLTVKRRQLTLGSGTLVIADKDYDASDVYTAGGIIIGTANGVIAGDGTITAEVTLKYQNGGNAGTAIPMIGASTKLTGDQAASYVLQNLADGEYFGLIRKISLAVKFKNRIAATALTYGDALLSSYVESYLEYTGFVAGQSRDNPANNVRGTAEVGWSGLTSVQPVKVYDPVNGDNYYRVTLSKGTLASANYEISTEGGLVEIKPRELRLTSVTLSAKTYDGGVNAVIASQTVTGRYSGDLQTDIYFANVRAQFESPSAGNGVRYTVSYDNELAGAKAGNYFMSALSVHEGYADITPAELILTINSKTNRYLEPVPALDYTITGFLNGDALPDGVTVSLAVSATTNLAVGFYSIYCVNTAELQGAVAPNYRLSVTEGRLNVLAAQIPSTGMSFTPGGTKRYDGQPFTIEFIPGALAAYAGAYSSEFSVNGVKSASAPRISDYGTYDVSVTVTASSNYTFDNGAKTVSLPTVKFIITQATVTVKVTDLSRDKSEGNPVFGFTLAEGSAFVGDDTVADLGAYEITCGASSDSPAGSYPITLTFLTVTNYTVNIVTGTLTVTDLFGGDSAEARTADGVTEVQFVGAPDNLALSVSVYGADSGEAKGYNSAASGYAASYEAVFVAEISIGGNGNSPVGVRIKIPDDYKGNKDCLLMSVDEDGKLTRVNAVSKNGSFEFVTRAGGTYVIIAPAKSNNSMWGIIGGAGGGGLAALIILGILIAHGRKKRALKKKAEHEQELLKHMEG